MIVGLVGLAQRCELADRGRASRATRIGEGVGERLEDPLGNLPVPARRDFLEGLVGMQRQRAAQRADRLVDPARSMGRPAVRCRCQ